MPMLRTDGTFMLPEHFSMDPARLSSWKKMPKTPMTAKYREASAAISSEPPSQ